MSSKRPYNFSWVIDGLLAGSGLPGEPAHVQYYLDENIDILVSLTEWKPSLYLAPGQLVKLMNIVASGKTAR